MTVIQFESCMRRVMVFSFRPRLMFLALLLLSIIGLLLNYSQPDVRLCFVDGGPEALQTQALPLDAARPQRLEDVLLAREQPKPGQSIFFHETSCNRPLRSRVNKIFGSEQLLQSEMHINYAELTARQACAIESAALHNPQTSVFVLFASPRYSRLNISENPMLEAVMSYPNVHLRNLNLWTYAAGTPIYEWLKDGALFKSSYVLSHISDFLRYLTLWRWGGTYLDLDVIVLRNMEEMPPNYVGAESNTYLAAGVMNFSPDGFGHEVAEQCLLDFQRNFDGGNWGNNGPGVITRVMQQICVTKNIELMQDRHRCMGFQVFGREAFYAIPFVEWEHFFEAEYVEQTLERTRSSYVAHFWNKYSNVRRFKVGSNCAYGKLAEQHCPRVYRSAEWSKWFQTSLLVQNFEWPKVGLSAGCVLMTIVL